MMTARVFYVLVAGSGLEPGWYYQFATDDPVGPFDGPVEAGAAARAVIVAAAEREEGQS